MGLLNLCFTVALLSRGRHKRGGNLNVPVRLAAALPTRDVLKLKNPLMKHIIHSVIEEVD